jgi:hypothetical protein
VQLEAMATLVLTRPGRQDEVAMASRQTWDASGSASRAGTVTIVTSLVSRR